MSSGRPILTCNSEDGALDVIIVLDFEISPTLHAIHLQPMPAQCVLPVGHPLAKGPVALKALTAEPFILLDIPKTRDYFLSVFGDLGLQPNIAMRAQSADMVRGLVANGFGYSLLNFATADRADLAYRPLSGHTRPSNLVAVRPYRRRPSTLGDDFVAQAMAAVDGARLNAAAVH